MGTCDNQCVYNCRSVLGYLLYWSIMKKKEVNSFAAYQEWTEQMWAGNPKKKYNIRDLFVMTAGLGGETGEVLEILKKSERAKKKPDINHLAEELGDVLYYLA